MDYDFIVVGAGPSGSSFSRIISKKYKVLLVDIRRLDIMDNFKFSKTCGGLLNPTAQKELALLNTSIPYFVLKGPQMFTVRAIDFDNKLSSSYQKHYLNIDRELFDKYLFSLVPNHVDKLMGWRYVSHKKTNNYLEVKLSNSKDTKIVTCRRIISADGAGSRIRRVFYPEYDLPDVYACPQAHFHVEKPLDYMFAYFDKEISDYYSWGIQKENTLIIGSAIPDLKNANNNFSILLNKLSSLDLKLGDMLKREGALLFRPKSYKDIFLGKKPVHFIGEAAGLISPSSSEGISFALKSGRILAEAINKSYAGFEYEYLKKSKSMILKIAYKISLAKFMYGKIYRNGIIKSDLLSVTKHSNNIKF